MSPYVFVSNDSIRYFDPTGKWQTDGHYWTVFLVATMLDLPNAREIAYYTEYPDTIINGENASERYTWAIPFVQQNTHSLTGKNGRQATLDARVAIFNENPSNLKEIGRLLHLFGDTYAHRKLNGEGELYGNFGFTIDHAASDGSEPDMIGNRPDLYLEYVKNLKLVLKGIYGSGENANFDINVFNRLANFASNNGGTPISLLGIINYEVAKNQGNNSFVVRNVQSLLSTSEAYQTQVANTKSYLDKQGVNYTTENVYKTTSSPDPLNPGMTRTTKTLTGTRFNIQE